MKRLNWKIIAENIAEAREELEKIEANIASGKRPHVMELELQFEHAYHHLNFAWNTRRMTTKEYDNMTDNDFNVFGRYPKDLELPQLSAQRKSKGEAG